MEQNRLCVFTCYKARTMNGAFDLEHYYDTIAETVDAVSKLESSALERGYPGSDADEWLIVQVRVNTIHKDNRFHYRSTVEEAIGIYGKDGKLRHLDGTEWGRIG